MKLSRSFLSILVAALITGAACLFSPRAFAGSCCGGGGGTTLVMPSFYRSMIDVSFDIEYYAGLWNTSGKYQKNPVGYQYRMNFGYAHRLARRSQASISLPYVWNDNQYSNGSTHSNNIGDTTLNLWYEALEDRSAWKIRSAEDLMPALTIGPSILIPTGLSPYDENPNLSSYYVTGRGFYRLDGNILVDKTFHPWSVSLQLSYGTYLERPVNREYGKYVKPYRKKLGDRTFASTSLSYIYYIGTAGDTLTGTVTYSYLSEDDATINGNRQPSSGFLKNAVGGGITYSSTDHDWKVRTTWSHAVRRTGWGKNFPTTDIYTVGVSYGFR